MLVQIPQCQRLQKAMVQFELDRKSISEIQRWLLPAELPTVPGFEMAVHYLPSELAGGDYYDVIPLAPHKWGYVLADVSGHGTPAAVIMAVMRTLVHANLDETRGKPPHAFLETLNRHMSRTYLRDGRFVTLWCGMFDDETRKLTYACAGHNPPRLCRSGRLHDLNECAGLPLGIDPDCAYDQTTITLEPGDLLALYTDGITEAMSDYPHFEGELFGTSRLDSLLRSAPRTPDLDDTISHILDGVRDFTGDRPPCDDQTLLIARCR